MFKLSLFLDDEEFFDKLFFSFLMFIIGFTSVTRFDCLLLCISVIFISLAFFNKLCASLFLSIDNILFDLFWTILIFFLFLEGLFLILISVSLHTFSSSTLIVLLPLLSFCLFFFYFTINIR